MRGGRADKRLVEIPAKTSRSKKIENHHCKRNKIKKQDRPSNSRTYSSVLISGDYDIARFLLASGSFGDSLNHAYRADEEGEARRFLYCFDR